MDGEAVGNALLTAVGEGDVNVAQRLMETEPLARVTKFNFNNRGVVQVTPLMLTLALPKPSVAMVEMLLGYNDPNSVDNRGRPALAFAAGNVDAEDVNAARVLMQDERTDVNLKDIDGATPLAIAAFQCNIPMVRLLASNKDVNLDAVTNDGQMTRNLCKCGDVAGSAQTCRDIIDQAAVARLRDRPRQVVSALKRTIQGEITGRRGAEKTLPPLPSDVWNLVLKRATQQQLCKDLENISQGRLSKLLTFAEASFGIPPDVIEEWRNGWPQHLARLGKRPPVNVHGANLNRIHP